MKSKKIIIKLLCIFVITMQSSVFAAGAMDSAPETSLPTGGSDTPYAPGQQWQQEQQEQQEQKEQNNSSQSSAGLLGESTASGDHTAGDIISDANNFINAGKNEDSKIDTDKIQTASNTLYNILLSIGIVIAVIVGMYLGIKFMMSSAEDKAKVKESLIPYIAGCVVIFGAFIIWKLAILLLNGLS